MKTLGKNKIVDRHGSAQQHGAQIFYYISINMKCWNSAFNAQGSRLITVICSGRSSENICSSSGRFKALKKKGKTRWNFSFTAKIGGKTSLGPSYLVLTNSDLARNHLFNRF